MNTAEYLNTKNKENWFVNIVNRHLSNKSNINSTIKTSGKVVVELKLPNENSDTKKEGIQQTKARLRESLMKK
jgi:hypothetical protein